MTAGMAAASPAAVATSASEIPGATTASDAEPRWPISWNETMMPHTVPKSPINGEVDETIERKDKNLVASLVAEISANRSVPVLRDRLAKNLYKKELSVTSFSPKRSDSKELCSLEFHSLRNKKR